MALYREGRVTEAIDALSRWVQSPLDEPAELARGYLQLGALHAATGDASSAERDFAVALAIDPELEAPAELGPSLRGAFDRARASASAMTLQVRTAVSEHATTLQLELAHAPPGLVVAFRARVEAGAEPFVARAEGDARVEVVLPRAAFAGAPQASVVVEALTLQGASALRVRSTVAAPATLSAEQVAEESLAAALADPAPLEPARGVEEEPWLWILVGVVVAGAGLGLGLGFGLQQGQDTALRFAAPEVVP